LTVQWNMPRKYSMAAAARPPTLLSPSRRDGPLPRPPGRSVRVAKTGGCVRLLCSPVWVVGGQLWTELSGEPARLQVRLCIRNVRQKARQHVAAVIRTCGEGGYGPGASPVQTMLGRDSRPGPRRSAGRRGPESGSACGGYETPEEVQHQAEPRIGEHSAGLCVKSLPPKALR